MDKASRAAPPTHLPSDESNTKTDDYFGDAVASIYSTQRTDSYASNSTYPSSTHSHSSKSSGWVKTAPTTNVHTTCGRHTDQLLFGGPSLRGLAKAMWKG